MSTFRTLLLTALTLAPCAFSVETKTWTHREQPDFEKGTLKNLSLRSDGRLTLAPAFREIFDASTAYLWALAEDSKGTLYAGGGNPSATTAKLFAIDSTGKSRTVAELPSLEIHAIAIDKKDRVYVATAPDGKVFRIGTDGKHETFYDPKAKYIWSMAFSSKGDLFLATGDEGEIHRVGQDGHGTLFFKTEETHARSLVIDSADNLLVGTEPGGLILRISPAGEGFVLYQAAKKEVTALAVASDGSLYAAAAGNKPALSSISSSGGASLSVSIPPAPIVSPAGGARPGTQPPAPAPIAPLPPPASVAGGSEVYRIGKDGYPQRVWAHAQDIVYAIGFDAAGKPVLGTGNKGNIFRVDSELIATLLINAQPTQVTAILNGAKGRLYAATSNVGKIYQIGPGLEKQGTYESEALDGGFFSSWGRVRQKSDPNGGTLRFETRSGNLDRPQKNWSDWSALDPSGRVASPSARFLQYRAVLNAAQDGRSPEVREIEIAYKSKNAPPVIEVVEITPANYKFPAPLNPSTSPQTITLPALGQPKRPAPVVGSATPSSQTVQYAKGNIGVRWAASDPNGDDLVYKAEIRGIQEMEWKLLKEKIVEKYLSWESSGYPDGEYVVRISASDSVDNPPDQALYTVLESDRFVIDNTPPTISGLAGTRTAGKLSIRWRARDERSVIQKAEYALNGGDWVVVEPTTRLSDSLDHEYNLATEASGAEVTVAVRVADEYENQSVEKVIIR